MHTKKIALLLVVFLLCIAPFTLNASPPSSPLNRSAPGDFIAPHYTYQNTYGSTTTGTVGAALLGLVVPDLGVLLGEIHVVRCHDYCSDAATKARIAYSILAGGDNFEQRVTLFLKSKMGAQCFLFCNRFANKQAHHQDFIRDFLSNFLPISPSDNAFDRNAQMLLAAVMNIRSSHSNSAPTFLELFLSQFKNENDVKSFCQSNQRCVHIVNNLVHYHRADKQGQTKTITVAPQQQSRLPLRRNSRELDTAVGDNADDPNAWSD